MLVFGFVHYYKSNNIEDIYRLCQISISSLSFINKKVRNKDKDWVGYFLKSLQPCWIVDAKWY